MVTGHTGHDRDHIALVVLTIFKIFLVDLVGHEEHMAGDVFLRFCVAGKVQMVVGTVGRPGVAEVAVYAKCGFPGIHRFIEVVVTDIFWQDLEVPFGRFVVGGPHGGYTDRR